MKFFRQGQEDPLPANGPGIYITGNKELLLDGKAELLLYTDEKIVLQPCGCGYAVTVRGKCLKLNTAGRAGISVRGIISAVQFGDEA